MPLSNAEILSILYKNFDPASVASKEFYVDCTDVRGGTVFAHKLCVALTEAQDADSKKQGYIHALFAGHIGGGKSSELRHLQDKMEDKNPPKDYKRFFPVFVDMKDYLDDFDAAREEILLAIVAEMASSFKEKENITLKDSYLSKRFAEIKGILFSDMDVDVSTEFDLYNFKIEMKRLKTSFESRVKVREALHGKMSNLLDEINTLFIQARTKLKKHTPKNGGQRYTDFVLIVDALDRLYGYSDKNTPDDSQRALFLDDSSVLVGLNAHCVFTIALAAMRADETDLTMKYGARKPFLLPMIKTEHRGSKHEKYETGWERLKEIIKKRLPEGVTIEQVFQKDALDFLIQYSAGHVRSLLMFAREATLYGERTLPISLKAAQYSVAENITFHNPKDGQNDWDRLAKLEANGTQEWHTQNADERRLLEQLFVVEYINGGEDDPFNEMSPWYAVNPIVRELNPFKRALERLKNKPQGA